MKQRLVKGFLVLALLCFLPGMMFCKGQPVQANPGDSEEEQEEEKSEDTDTGELEQKRQNALDQIKSIKSDISTVEDQIKDLKNSKSDLQTYINKLDQEVNTLSAKIRTLQEQVSTQEAKIGDKKEEIEQNNKKQSHYIRNGSCSISDRTGNDRRESAFQPDAGSSGASLCIYYPGSFPEPEGWYSG